MVKVWGMNWNFHVVPALSQQYRNAAGLGSVRHSCPQLLSLQFSLLQNELSISSSQSGISIDSSVGSAGAAGGLEHPLSFFLGLGICRAVPHVFPRSSLTDAVQHFLPFEICHQRGASSVVDGLSCALKLVSWRWLCLAWDSVGLSSQKPPMLLPLPAPGHLQSVWETAQGTSGMHGKWSPCAWCLLCPGCQEDVRPSPTDAAWVLEIKFSCLHLPVTNGDNGLFNAAYKFRMWHCFFLEAHRSLRSLKQMKSFNSKRVNWTFNKDNKNQIHSLYLFYLEMV